MRVRSKAMRLMAAALLGLGVVVGALGVGPDDAPAAIAAAPVTRYYSEGELPEYPGSAEFPLGDGMAVNGFPLRVSHFSTDDSAEKVRDYYLAEFRRNGLSPQYVAQDDGTQNVTANSADGVTQYVIAIAPRKKGSEVFPSAVPMDSEPVETIPDGDLPLSPGAVGVMRVTARGEGAGGSVTYQEPLSTVAEAVQYVAAEMSARGWTVSEKKHDAAGSAVVSVARGSSRSQFTLTPYRHTGRGVAVFAQYGKGEAAP